MPKERIFIVEDEGIVAADLQSLLQEMGYQVVGIASTGEDAVESVEKMLPDLVLMDIRLKGSMDGIDAAEQIIARLNIPVTYLTAYADDTTLTRAKTTIPYGYILKPFQEKDLRTAIELALYRHRMESMMATIGGWHETALRGLSEPVIATDLQGHITFMNEVAESLLGWKITEAYGKKITEFLTALKPTEVMTAIDHAGKDSTPYYAPDPASLVTRKGQKVQVSYSLSSVKNEKGTTTGIIIILRALAQQPK